MANVTVQLASALNDTAGLSQPRPLPTGAIETATACFMYFMLLMVPGQAFIVFCIASERSFRKTVNFMLINQMAAGFGYLVSFSILFNYYLFVNRNETVCRISAVVQHVSSCTVFVNTALMSINRYVALCKDSAMKQRIFTPRNTTLMIASTWVVGLIAAICPMIEDAPAYGSMHNCYPDVSDLTRWQSLYTFIYSLLVDMYLCFAITIYCNYRMYKKLKTHIEQMNSSVIQGQVDVSRYKEVQTMLLIFIMMPIIMSSPAGAACFIPAVAQNPWIGRGAIALNYMVPVIEPYVVITCLKPFRDKAKAVYRRVCCRNRNVDEVIDLTAVNSTSTSNKQESGTA